MATNANPGPGCPSMAAYYHWRRDQGATVAPGAPLSDVEAIGELRTALGLFHGADAEAVVQAVHSLLLRVDALELVVAESRGELG